jgi:hypothetical protein
MKSSEKQDMTSILMSIISDHFIVFPLFMGDSIVMAQASRTARQLKAKHGPVTLLQKQLQGCQMNLR